MKQHMAFLLLKLLPRNLISRLVGRLVSLNLPYPLNRLSVSTFAGYYGINLLEAEKPVHEYGSIQKLFTRRLKAGARPIMGKLVHPADSRITSNGRISSDEVIQAKGISYSLKALLGEDASDYEGGYYITYYLCPTDYHRVHSPADFQVEKVRFIPGDLWPVDDFSVIKVPQLFAINERVVAVGKVGRKKLAMVMVGATNVGKIELSFVKGVSNVGGIIREVEVDKKLEAGEEFGTFYMGSTVILVLDKNFEVTEVESGIVNLGQALKEPQVQ